MYAFFESILRVTAWPMTPPAPYSAFHILLTLFGAGLAVFFARIFRKKIRSTSAPEPYFRRILFSCGVLLALMELYKQAFLYVIEFDSHFNWWYFPFQLCSVPMYICLAAPLLRSGTDTPPRRNFSPGLRSAWWNHGSGRSTGAHASVLDDDAARVYLAFYPAPFGAFILHVRQCRTYTAGLSGNSPVLSPLLPDRLRDQHRRRSHR